MRHVDQTQTDIAQWIKSLLPPELWERYCHLTYARMAEAPELAEYSDDLREAERDWYRASVARRKGGAFLYEVTYDMNRRAGSTRSHL
jgi:hypothetical protein